MGEWRTIHLGDVCAFMGSGGTPSRKVPEYFRGDIPWVKTQEIKQQAIYETEENISDDALEKSSAKLLPRGSVLVAMYGGGTVGNVAWIERPMATNQAACGLVLDEQLADPRFVYYCLLGRREELIGLANGAAQQNLSVGTLRNLLISVPELSAQKRIGQLLRAIDDKIAANYRAFVGARELALSLVRHSASAFTELGALVRHCRDQRMPSEEGATGVHHFSLPAFDGGQNVSVEDPKTIKSAKFRVDEPSVLFSKLNPHTPRVWLVQPDVGVNSYASTEFLVLQPRSISPHLLWLVCAQPEVFGGLVGMSRGTSNSHQRVSPVEVLECQVVDPRRLPASVVEECEWLMAMSVSLHREISHLKEVRNALLPKLMDGTLAVRAAEDLVSDVI